MAEQLWSKDMGGKKKDTKGQAYAKKKIAADAMEKTPFSAADRVKQIKGKNKDMKNIMKDLDNS